MQKQRLCWAGPSPVNPQLRNLLTVAAHERPEPDMLMDDSLFQFWPFRWDSIVYPKEQFANIHPACWSCSSVQKDVISFFTLCQKHSPPHHSTVWRRPRYDGELAWPGTAEPSLLCWEQWLEAKIPCSRDSWRHFVAEGARRPWVCREPSLSLALPDLFRASS